MPTARVDNYSIASGAGLFAGGVVSGLAVSPLTIGYHLATPEHLTFNCPAARPLVEGTTVQLYYKLPISGIWIEAHPLLYVRAAEVANGSPTTIVNACKGTIYDLVPGQTYDWRIVGTEPGVGVWELTGQRATRDLPAAAGIPTVTATTATTSNLQAVCNALTPGAVLQLANGTYPLSSMLQIAAVGTESQPIYIRGQSKTGVIISRASGVVVQITTGAHLVIENLTIQGSGVDSGTAASSVGIEFWGGGAAQQGVTIRDIEMVGSDKGISTINARQVLVYNVNATGNNTWDKAYQDNGGQPNLTWNDDGLLLAGEGNCAWNCTLTGFGDATASGHASGGGRANYFYRLDIPMTGDDAHEFDYTDGPCAFYDNRIGNCGTVCSWQPAFGGPAMAFRNAAANTIRGPWKFNDVNHGALVYFNTVLRTPGTHGFGIYQSGQGGSYFQRAMSHRGNLYALRGAPTEVLRFDSLCDRLDWTHNGYTQDGSFDWAASGGGATASLAAARASLPARVTLFGAGQRHANDIILNSANPWVETLTLGADHTTQFTSSPTYVLSGDSNALGAGVHIPGITDGFSGAAPALGAVIPGRLAPAVGCSDGDTPDAWLAALPAGHWGTVPAGNTCASQDPAADPAANPNYPGLPPWNSSAGGNLFASGGWSRIMSAWCGAAFDSDSGTLHLNAPGGHTDYFGNASVKLRLDLAVPVWQRYSNPSILPTYSGGESTGRYSDGRMRSVHTYNSNVYVPGLGPVLCPPHGMATSGGAGPGEVVSFSETSGLETFWAATALGSESGAAACWDADLGVVWHRSHGTQPMRNWNRTRAPQHVAVGGVIALNSSVSLCHLQGLGCVLLGNGDDTSAGPGVPSQTLLGGWAVFDTVTGVLHTPTFTGAPTATPQPTLGVWPGSCKPMWDAARRCAYVWDKRANTTQILRLTPGANPRTDPWVIDTLPVSGSNTVTPTVAQNAGTFGRAWFWRDCVFVVNAVDQPVYFFKVA